MLHKVSQSRKNIILLAALWTICLISVGLLIYRNWNVEFQKHIALEAQTIISKDMSFRSWTAMHGGVYVPPTEITPPNPYLDYVADRDVVTTNGKKLTLMNPAYMIRQVMSEYENIYGAMGHITSLKPINPANAPDEWETSALKGFEDNLDSVNAIFQAEGMKVYRQMIPLITKKACLKCHAKQGYREGDIRGGISVTLPVTNFYHTLRNNYINETLILLGIYMFGLLGLFYTARSVRKREKTEDELRDFRKTLDNTFDCVFMFEPYTFKFTYVNRGAIEQVGYSYDELMQMTPIDIKPEFTFESFMEMVTPLLTAQEESITFQTVHRHRDGHDVPVEIILQFNASHSEGGRLFAIVRDITEIKRKEESLNRALAEKTELVNRLDMLNRAIEATQVGITICNNERDIIYINEADARMHGYTIAELLGKKTSVYSNKEPEELLHLQDMTLVDGWVRESINISSDGTEFPVLLSSVFIHDDEGRPSAMVTACEDISEIKAVQEETAKNERFLDSILNSTDEPIMVIGADYKIIMMNERARQNAKHNAGESAQHYCYQISHHRDTPCEEKEHKCPLKEVFRTGSSFTEVHLHKDENENDRYIEVLASPIFGENGSVEAVVESNRDITDLIHIEQNLKQALNDKEMLIKEVHHRVKNNLAVIQSLLSLQSYQSHEESAKHALNESQSRVMAMSMIHERLYRSSDLSTIEFSDYIANLAEQIFENYCTNKQDVTLRVDIPMVSIDIDTIIPCGLIVNELLTNTFKYAFPEGRKGEVFVGVEYDEADQMFMVVSDNGVGLPEGFNISATDSLGMKIVKSLSAQIGSEVQIHSDENATVFKVLLLKAILQPLVWNDTHHLIGHELIDKQHRQLYDAIESLRNAIEAGKHDLGISNIIPALLDYVSEHFKTEENIMVEHNYSDYEPHKQAHTEFKKKAQNTVSEIQAGKTGLSLSVYNFLANWLMDHMWAADRELGVFMKGKGLTVSSVKEELQKGRFQVLYIEDDRLAQGTMSRFFQKNGISYLPAISGNDAIRELEENSFELIISDVMLPDMDGIEVIKLARASGVEIPVLFLTGKNSNDISEQAKGLNVLGILQKPVSFPDLRKILLKYFEKQT